MLKVGIDDRHLKIYEIYIERIKKEADLIWSRFKIYFSFISGILVTIGYLLLPSINNKSFDIPEHVFWTAIFLCITGMVFSIFWYFINTNGSGWQNLMKSVIRDVEDYIFIDKYIIEKNKKAKRYALYQRIDGPETVPLHRSDVTIINLLVSWTFFFIFVVIAISLSIATFC